MSKRMPGWRSIARLAAVGAAGLATGCSPRTDVSEPVVRPVRTMVVVGDEETSNRVFPGVADAVRNAQLAFQVNGLLVEFPVKEGQAVKKGEVIARLRPDEFEARLKSLQGQLDQAQATLRALRAGEREEEIRRLDAQLRAAEARLANARIEYNRAQRLRPSGSISQSNYDRAETEFRVAQEEQEAARQAREQGSIARAEDIEAQEGVVRGLEGQVVEASIQLEDTTLRAPHDGVIAQRFVEQNQNVRAKDPIVRFQDAQELEIATDVPEAVMASLRRADIARLDAEFAAAPGIRFPVEIRELAQAADPATQTFKVRVSLLVPPGLNLLPGMTATVNLAYRRAGILGKRILVPFAAVVQDDAGKQLVWVLGEDGTVARRAVEVGQAAGGQIEIAAGLEVGERIVVAGVSHLRDGMKVRDLGDALGERKP